MPVELSHERLDVYRLYLEVANLCGTIVSNIDEPIAALDHLERTIESIGTNLIRANVQGAGSPQRASHLDTSIASTHECAASLDVCFVKQAIEQETHRTGTDKLWRIRGMLLGLKQANANRIREEDVPYGSHRFPFADLDMYEAALEGVCWAHDLLVKSPSKARTKRKLDVSTTGFVLNIAEGHGRATTADRNRFMKIALEHACKTVLLLDLMVARKEATKSRIAVGKTIQVRVISVLHAWRRRAGE